MQANRQWSSRPADERFTSLDAMLHHFRALRAASRSAVVSSRSVAAVPDADNAGLTIAGKAGVEYSPTHWSFGQLATLAGAPAGYLRTLPSPLAADLLNWGLHKARDVEDVGLLLQAPEGSRTLAAATGPNYGRVWNADVVGALVNRFGDGVTGDFKVPGEFGHDVTVTRANTTLFAGDRDMFVFLADEKNRIELPNRRDGQTGTLARGFFVWNSEVGSQTLGIGTFLFDYVCCNRIVWGADQYKEIRIRHTSGAPDRFIEEVAPALERYADSSTASSTKAIEDARAARLDDVSAFLNSRWSRKMSAELMATHELEEGRPIETLWDVTTAATAVARSIVNQDARVALEREAGAIMSMAA